MSDLADFLSIYAKAYESYDPAKVAKFFYCPCIFFLRSESTLLDTWEGIHTFLEAGLRIYRNNGCFIFKAFLHEERLVGPRYALIDVEWAPENADGLRVMNFETTYNLVKEPSGWKVAVITRHDM